MIIDVSDRVWDDNGCECHYYAMGDSPMGLKVYAEDADRDWALRYQRLAHAGGFGPACAGPVLAKVMDGIYKPAYLTQKAVIRADNDSGSDYSVLVEQIKSLGLSPRDLRWDNIGRIDGRLVCVDFGRESTD
jgi:hypothetical protein